MDNKPEGGVQVTLLVDLQTRLGILEASQATANEQRTMILKEVLHIRDQLAGVRLNTYRLDKMEPEVELGRAMRQKFEGGLIITRLIWLAAGGAAAAFIQWLATRN